MSAEGTEEAPLALVEVAHLSDTGRVRHHNEDRSLATHRLLAVADGMGGAKAGEVAAQVAVDSVARLEDGAGADDVRDALERANRAIRRMARDDPDMSGMGTTMTAALLRDGNLDVVHVGDSRAYLWRDGHLTQVTDDHSVVAELVRRGSITPEEAETHPHRNVITRALGAEAEVTVDLLTTTLADGDVVLVCSDGLSSYVSEAAIAEVLAASGTLGETARGLVARANAAGGADNVTVVLGRVGVAAPRPGGDTQESPVLEGDGAGPPTTEMRVLGGVHGHAGAGRTGSLPARPPQVLERAGRRRSRVVPVLVGVLVLLAAVVGGVAWIASRTYTLQAGPDGTVRVAHGLPLSPLGQDLSVDWQDTGVPVDAVRAGQPGALSSSARGQGEAVELAADLVWRFGVTAAPTVGAPPTSAPTPPGETKPTRTTAP
jgi:serine/threonine protein phosphatase PrpC